MSKQFTVSHLCDLINVSTQYLYKVIQKPIAGQPYDPNVVNYVELQKFLLRKYSNNANAVCEALNIEDINDIEIVKGSKNLTANANKVAVDDLKIEGTYVLRSYHYENTYVLRNVIEMADDVVYIFEQLSETKSTKDKYRALTLKELSADRFTIKEA